VYTQFYEVRLVVLALAVLLDLYAVGLWLFAFVRTRQWFCLLLAFCAAGALLFTLVQGAFAYDFLAMKRFDPANRLYGFSYFVLQPVIAVLTIIGETLLVIWLARPRAKNPSEV
jgi:hypothetical protein